MRVKEKILELFENNIGQNISGAQIAESLGVSRNAVWKAVKSLQEEGYSISAVTNKGYCMSNDNDIISTASVQKYLGDLAGEFDIVVVKTITSTNTVLKEEASKGAAEGRIIIACEQTAGRGRMNRQFYSPAQSGIYLSILLRPQMSAGDSLYITTAAAVAVSKAIEDIAPVKAEIKWVNDIFCNGRKVCGILTEASINVESGRLDYAVLGIGINITKPKGDFPDDIKNIAASIFEDGEYDGQAKSRLSALVIKYFWEYYKEIETKSFMAEYKKRSFVIGKDIYIIRNREAEDIRAKVIDIDNQARLIVKLEDGSEEILSSGEISIRPVE